jgi:hypothetical protein
LELDRNRTASFELLSQLLCVVIDMDDGARIPIVLENQWTPAWPRPAVVDRHVVYLEVRPDGSVDFESFSTEVSNVSSTRKDWWTKLALAPLVADGSFNIAVALQCLVGRKSLVSLSKQIVWFLGSKLQHAITAAPPGVAFRGFKVERDGEESLLDAASVAALEYHLVQYVESHKEEVRTLKARAFSCCTDKAGMCGLGSGVQNTAFSVNKANLGIVSAPQASPTLFASSYTHAQALVTNMRTQRATARKVLCCLMQPQKNVLRDVYVGTGAIQKGKTIR